MLLQANSTNFTIKQFGPFDYQTISSFRSPLYLIFFRSSPNFSEFKHRSTVYTVCWGPPISDSIRNIATAKKVLYSCGDNAVFMHDDALKKSTNVEKIRDVDKERRAPKRSDVAFEPSRYRLDHCY